MARVAALMEDWAHGLDLGEVEALRWAAAGWLHDALRDADPAELVHEVALEERDLPPQVLHGPAAAARLCGQIDPRLEMAIRYHTIGHPRLERLGRALYLADFLEPGRTFAPEWRADLRRRMPREMNAVLEEVIDARLRHLLAQHNPIRPETAAFWNATISRRKS